MTHKKSPPSKKRLRAWKTNRRRLTIEDMQQAAQERGGLCLSEDYINSISYLQWQCANKHQWLATSHSVKLGKWCRICLADSVRSNLEQLQALAQQRGGQLLSKRYVDDRTKMRWCCANGHIWKATQPQVQQGHWCTRCFHDGVRSRIEEMQALARAKGGRCLSEIYINADTALQWQCAAGHIWQSKPSRIYDHWCPACKYDRNLGIEKMQEWAAQRGGRCLSTVYENRTAPLEWQCMEGHRWEARPVSVQRGSWCPQCRLIARDKKKILDDTQKREDSLCR